MATRTRAELGQRWEDTTRWPLVGSALLFLVAYAVPIINPEVPRIVKVICNWVDWVTWAMFALDYVVRLVLSVDRKRFLLKHWLDLLIVALPLLRPLRLLRLLPLVTVLNRRATTLLRGRVAMYVAVGSTLVAIVAALTMLSVERGRPGANIENIGDALWWAAETMTTVGYGDVYPVTPWGRVIAVGLMICGIGLLGTVTATLASWLVEHVSAAEESDTKQLLGRIDRLEATIERLHARLPVPDAGEPTPDEGPDEGQPAQPSSTTV